MTQLILIRHGETDWNVVRRLQGHLDIGLNAIGHQQAAAVAAALSDEQIHAVYSSDMQRTQATAAAIAAARGIPVRLDPALRERCYGDLQGLTHTEITQRYPADFKAWMERDPDARYTSTQAALADPDLLAETLREFSARVVATITGLAAAAAEHTAPETAPTIVIVTHGGVLDCLHRHVTGSDLQSARNFTIANAGINRLHWNGSRFSIVHWGDVAHLAQPALDEIDTLVR